MLASQGQGFDSQGLGKYRTQSWANFTHQIGLLPIHLNLFYKPVTEQALVTLDRRPAFQS